MTITARYNGVCKKCGGHITAGEAIEWQKGKGSSHVTCPATPATAPQPAAAPARTRRSEKQRPEGPTLARAQGRAPFAVGDVTTATLSQDAVAALQERQSVTAVEVAPLVGGKARRQGQLGVAVRVVWAASLSNHDVEELDAWSHQHSAVVELATGDEAEAIAEARRQENMQTELAARFREIFRHAQEYGVRQEGDFYRATPDGTVWDGRSQNSAGSTGDCLAVQGDLVVAHTDHGYDMYLGARVVCEDAALAAEVRELAAEAGPEMAQATWTS